jgi:hypothetical protein
MASSFVASRIQLIYALCLPLAVLLGYFLSDPLDPASMVMIFIVVGVLSIPLLMRWHHPLLIFTWNAAFAPYFIPGQPFLWMGLAFVSLSFAVVSRFTHPDVKFIWVTSLARPLLFLAGVVVMTAWLRGGVGLQFLGSARYGGKGYLYVLASIAGYFALTSQRLPVERSRLFVGLFLLSGLTSLIPNLAYLGGEAYYFVFYLFPAVYAGEQARMDYLLNAPFTRLYGMGLAIIALICWLLARYGIRQLFDWKKPWRPLLFALCVGGTLFSGFRTELALVILVFLVQMYLEGFFRPRTFVISGAILLIAAFLLAPYAYNLPPVVQRTISFLPVELSPDIRLSAEGSSEWRLQMWRDLIPEVPRYLFLGKGYVINATEVAFAEQNVWRGYSGDYVTSLASGEYHNGLLTLLIPLGIWGVMGFGWFVVAAIRYLYRSYCDCEPELGTINAFLLAFFVARLLVFLFVFGSFYTDLFYFTGVLGLSVSLNGLKVAEPAEELAAEPVEELALGTKYESSS